MCIRDRLVTEASQQGLSVRRVAVALAALWLVSVDDAQDAAAGPIVSDDNLERICGCGEDAADLWYGLESVEYIDRVGIPKQQNEDVSLSLIHISEPTRLGMISYAVFCLKKKKKKKKKNISFFTISQKTIKQKS